MQYFVVMIDYGRRGREAIVDPEITRREVISRVASGEYRNISFIHEIADCSVEDITAEILSEAVLPDFGFSGAVDLFVFVGGYTAAILYGRMMLERGFVVTATRIFKRLWQLYAAYIVLFVIYINLIGYVARQSAAPALIGEFNVTGIVDHTVRTLIP